MVRLTRCKKCNKLLSSINEVSKYGDHGWKFSCCGTTYYKCNHETYSHICKHYHHFFYQNPQLLEKHITKCHLNQQEEVITVHLDDDIQTTSRKEISINLDNYIKTNIVSTSYEESSSLQRYFTENHCMESNAFPYEYQRIAIKKIITMACSKKGVLSLYR